jgi:hypothetical protein
MDTDEFDKASLCRLQQMEELLRSRGYVKDDRRGFWAVPGAAIETASLRDIKNTEEY